nr:Chain A, DAKD [Homo sapiens]6F3X_A Chain A, Kininogen-1 [Homo sapiens]6F3Y_A Chain A, Kininogen-1 [Homo sapiens]7EIB_D Chain D, LYS-ARG-PRO-PRO-GLY-PHE-SER-PRO-PHE [Homo sapiens]
KRPPGFSPF